jgi:hypothetical protein
MPDVLPFEAPWDRTHKFDPPAVFDRLRRERPLAGCGTRTGTSAGWPRAMNRHVR